MLKVYCVKCGHRGAGRHVVTPAKGRRPAFQALHPYPHKSVTGAGSASRHVGLQHPRKALWHDGWWCDGHRVPGSSERPRLEVPYIAGSRETRFRCAHPPCGKVTAGRLSHAAVALVSASVRYPRRHTYEGKPCPGNVLEAEWVDVEAHL